MPMCLVVDDSRIVRKIAIQILEGLQVETCEAENGAVALAMCEAEMPDIILLDWNMPVLNGIDFIKTLRRTAAGHHPKVLFCTTESEMTRIAEALESGADEYIMKPFDGDILSSKLRLVGAI